MINKFEIIKEDKNPKVLVVTPMLPGHKISRETKVTLKRNDLPIAWIKSIGMNNIPTNVELGLDWYLKRNNRVEYILPLDNDIILGRNMIDRMYKKIESVKNERFRFAFCYASFKFSGYINKEFPAENFDIQKLMQANYISSNSLINIYDLKSIGGFVKDDEYKRLLDWALWLKFVDNMFFGIPCPEASFVAISTKDDISAKDEFDYRIKANRVTRDFVQPLVEKIQKEMNYSRKSLNTKLI